MSSAHEKLFDEKLAVQSWRRDILKLKLTLTGITGAAGLGFIESFATNSILALCLIPFIVAYSDLLIRDCDLRIRILAAFFRNETDSDYAKYEKYISTDPEIQGARWTRFSHLSIREASYLTCILVLGVGIITFIIPNGYSKLVSIALCLSSFIGFAAIYKIHKDFKSTKSPIET